MYHYRLISLTYLRGMRLIGMVYDIKLRVLGSSKKIRHVKYHISILQDRLKMEQVPSLKLSQRITEELQQSRLNDDENSIVNAHCKRDHLSPSPFDERKNVSTYVLNHSPSKKMPNYNKPQMERQLQRFRKNENSTSALPNLPTILDNSHYGNSFHAHSLQKIQRGKEQQSWFLKMNWALDPKSSYQKNYLPKDGVTYNKQNRERPDHNHLTVFELHEGQKRGSNYMTQFQPYAIKKEAELVIGNKDHLSSKDSLKNTIAISEYQRRYDSVMEVAKPKETLVSIYKKEAAISRQPRLKL